MTSLPSEQPQPRPRRRKATSPRDGSTLLAMAFFCLSAAWFLTQIPPSSNSLRHLRQAVWVGHPQPLEMPGGDPYVRALMRTISAAESNTDQPYNVLYGGKVVRQLNRHPDICVQIVTGPNTGNCTTAAGRYQFLTYTWEEKAKHYHPGHPGWFGVLGEYSFDPVSQDMVVYNWLKDSAAWGADIPAMLRQGQIEDVLRLLSGTWTSLGYGIETNSMSAKLPRIYREVLEEELQQPTSLLQQDQS